MIRASVFSLSVQSGHICIDKNSVIRSPIKLFKCINRPAEHFRFNQYRTIFTASKLRS